MDKIGSIGSSNSIDFSMDDKKDMKDKQPQVAFINTIFEGFGNSSGTEASFNA